MSRIRINNTPRSFLLLALFGLFIGQYGFGQTLCDKPEGSVSGDFDIQMLQACNPQKVKVIDNSGGSNIRYNFVYQGQPASQLSGTVPFTNIHDYPGFTEPTVFTILQYGQKDGKPMYACKNILVRKSNRPLFSFLPCNGTSFTLSIPKDSLYNDFDKYEISFDNFSSANITTVNASELPYSKVFTKNLPTTFKISGVYNDDRKNCPANVPEDLVPNVAFDPSNGINPPIGGFNIKYHANISAVLLGKSNVEMDIEGSLAGASYSLFQRDINGNYPAEPIKRGLAPGRINVPLPDITKVSCFYVEKEDNTCFAEKSAEICTRPITSFVKSKDLHTLTIQDYVNRLFNTPNDPAEGIDVNVEGINAYLQIDGRIFPPVSFNSLKENFEFTVSDCKSEYCYYFETILTGQYNNVKFRSLTRTEQQCYSPQKETPLFDLSLAASMSNDNLAQISVITPLAKQAEIENLLLFHKDNNSYTQLPSIKPPLKVFQTKIKSDSISQCFKVGYQDVCGSTSEQSEEICTIFLKFEDNEKLRWTSESPFLDDIISYDVLVRGEDGNYNKAIHEAKPTEFSYTPNLNLYEDQVSFKILAKSSSGTSLSNFVTKELAPNIYIPSAFSPNDDGHNDFFTYLGNKKRVKSVDFKVWDRRGFIRYETNDKDFEWKPSSEDVTSGLYHYYLKVILDNQETIERSGLLEVLR